VNRPTIPVVQQVRRERPVESLSKWNLKRIAGQQRVSVCYIETRGIFLCYGQDRRKIQYSQRDPGLNQLKLDLLLKNLRADSRYAELLKKVFHGFDTASDSVNTKD